MPYSAIKYSFKFFILAPDVIPTLELFFFLWTTLPPISLHLMHACIIVRADTPSPSPDTKQKVLKVYGQCFPLLFLCMCFTCFLFQERRIKDTYLCFDVRANNSHVKGVLKLLHPNLTGCLSRSLRPCGCAREFDCTQLRSQLSAAFA